MRTIQTAQNENKSTSQDQTLFIHIKNRLFSLRKFTLNYRYFCLFILIMCLGLLPFHLKTSMNVLENHQLSHRKWPRKLCHGTYASHQVKYLLALTLKHIAIRDRIPLGNKNNLRIINIADFSKTILFNLHPKNQKNSLKSQNRKTGRNRPKTNKPSQRFTSPAHVNWVFVIAFTCMAWFGFKRD